MAISLEDRERIRETMARYDFAIDLGDAEAWANCFTADGEFVHSGALDPDTPARHYRGRDQLQAFAQSVIERTRGHLRHWNNGTQLIAGDGDLARVRSYIVAFSVGIHPVPVIVETGIYADHFRRVDGQWLIERREFCADPQPQHRGTPWDPAAFADEIR